MNTFGCPLGGECGGTGWEWTPPNDGPNPEPGHYEPCECNPYHLGEPDSPMVWLRLCDQVEMALDADDAPF
jgi:hypothetical protein